METNIDKYLIHLRECSQERNSDGKWLEAFTVEVAPHISEWNIKQCWPRDDWPDRKKHFPRTNRLDPGIDLVGVRHDGKIVAIQCKSRYQDGELRTINKGELSNFFNAASASIWQERWVVTNGPNPFTRTAENAEEWKDNEDRLKLVDIQKDLLDERGAGQGVLTEAEDSRQKMQDSCVSAAVAKLRDHARLDAGGIPKGEGRGKIILPCGTGKTRISLRIIEELTQNGDIAIVLCPSIALVAQIRREYLRSAKGEIRVLAVCSDSTVSPPGELPKDRKTVSSIMADYSYINWETLKGDVTTCSAEVVEFMQITREEECAIGIIIGTYQSSHKIAGALREAGKACVLICDEAHRTAGIHMQKLKEHNETLRNFTVCHDRDLFPVKYRIYQTATPKVYGEHLSGKSNAKWIVRDMDDAKIFGVELFRKSYIDAVRNGWLSDYRIIGLGINDRRAYDMANEMALSADGRKSKLSARDYIKGLAFALAMGNAVQHPDNLEKRPVIKSCIAFMNSIAGSRQMAKVLQGREVADWLRSYMKLHQLERDPADYKLVHLDAKDRVVRRESEKAKLSTGTQESPRAILNVGIFGEGVDSPSLSAVAFLAPRKSPIDIIQAVGRVMRISPEKELGYIIVPIEIPDIEDPERWLSTTHKNQGWKELGDILKALKAHDERIEDDLSDLLQFFLPAPLEQVATFVTIGKTPGEPVRHYIHVGKKSQVQRSLERVVEKDSDPSHENLIPVSEISHRISIRKHGEVTTTDNVVLDDIHVILATYKKGDGTVETRQDATVRVLSGGGEDKGLNLGKTKEHGWKMVNQGAGARLPYIGDKKPADPTDTARQGVADLFEKNKKAICMNLLPKSGLQVGKIEKELNMLEGCVAEAGRELRESGVGHALSRHLQMDTLGEEAQGDSCNISALILLNAAMLHQRIFEGDWIPIVPLGQLKNHPRIGRHLIREWEKIMRKDFEAVLTPAIDIVDTIQETGLEDGLTRALWGICAVAEKIATTYADMGADHAGKLFNKYMGNQQSDGAYFTRAPAASIAARLSLDALDIQDWRNPDIWKEHKAVDFACGSGTLLVALLADMKRRAELDGASKSDVGKLHQMAVQDTLTGLDINPLSLQLAATHMTTSTQNLRFRRMGLHLMPYGPMKGEENRVASGSLELLLQNKIVNREDLGMGDEELAQQSIWTGGMSDIEDVTERIAGSRIVIINPPFTKRRDMGKKFTKSIQKELTRRVDATQDILEGVFPEMKGVSDKNSLRPLFSALANCVLPNDRGVFVMINPTCSLTGISGLNERKMLSSQFHIHTILTCHQPKNVNLSEDANISESLIVMRRENKPGEPTRFISLDRFPTDSAEVADFHHLLLEKNGAGEIGNGWGEVSYCPKERIQAGDWSGGVWRSPVLAKAAYEYGIRSGMQTIAECGYSCAATLQMMEKKNFVPSTPSKPGSFPIISSKGADGQQTIQATPDAYWEPVEREDSRNDDLYGQKNPTRRKANLLQKAGHLLITSGQNTSTARLAAVASDEKYVGRGWLPIMHVPPASAKALAVFINSTPGRLQLMQKAGRTPQYPQYNPRPLETILVPDTRNDYAMDILADCWERTKDMKVPQYRQGECEVRRLWDEAVAEAMGWNVDELSNLRNLLHKEPHVCGLGYNQYRRQSPDT